MDDAISRQAAIKTINKMRDVCDTENLDDYRDLLVECFEAMPSAQPEIIRCGECKYLYVDGENVRFNVCELNHNKVQNDDWFCADAERKEGEA